MCTDKNKDDVYWRKMMLDTEFFNNLFTYYETNVLNSPIDKNAPEIMIKTNSKNYFELANHGVKGLPDCQIEHAIERYIGYLTVYNKKVLKV
jgi:hypothetical protein